jgi:NADH-quinone oxidoreductase subunit M
MPIWAFFMVLFAMSSIGLPGLNGFVSEFLTILAAFTSNKLGIAYGVLAATGIVLGAVYMLHMLARIVWGPLKTPHHDHDAPDAAHAPLPKDLNGREIACLVPIALAVVILGVRPNIILKTIEKPSQQIVQAVPTAPPGPANAVAQLAEK